VTRPEGAVGPMANRSRQTSAFPIALLVAPVPGRVRVLPARRFRAGREWVEHGDAVARIEHEGRSDAILAPVSGAMGGVLMRDGDPVRAGQPVAWMEAGESSA
jgi:biotin carboxyl carrier protein